MAKLDDSRSAAIKQYLERFVRFRWPALRSQHDDLVADALGDLATWVERRGAAPSDDELRRVGATIVRRRVADAVREHVRTHAVARLAELAPAPQAAPDRRLDARRTLGAVLEEIACWTEDERRLVLDRDDPDSEPLTNAERKRLERLRERLRRALARRGTRTPGESR